MVLYNCDAGAFPAKPCPQPLYSLCNVFTELGDYKLTNNLLRMFINTMETSVLDDLRQKLRF